MSIDKLVDIVHSGGLNTWSERNKDAFVSLFDGDGRRYRKSAKEAFALRAPAMSEDSGVPYAAYIHAANPNSGPYGGTSFVIFPAKEKSGLIAMGVGTQGLAPDAAILGRPGHARKAQAICAWLNSKYGDDRQVAWAKQDPTRTDISVPDGIAKDWSEYNSVFGRYGNVIYAMYKPDENRKATAEVLKAFLDLLLEERGFAPVSEFTADAASLKSQWLDHMMPSLERSNVVQLLEDRRFVIVQGPPGTGKTEIAMDLVRVEYKGNGRTVQFHPNTTYESFVGGLAPSQSDTQLGIGFRPTPGFLMEAAVEAAKNSKPYLLHIDEINRADLSKILGEAILLLEPRAKSPRTVQLQYDFGEPIGRKLSLPPNLHLLGTMNTADRSIAIVDVAVRRRFAFVSLWPQMSVVHENGCGLMQDAFRDILSIFVEHATDDSFNLVPGHSYFLEKDESKARQSLKVNLVPLLEEYLSQGYVGGFAEPIRGYLQWLRSL